MIDHLDLTGDDAVDACSYDTRDQSASNTPSNGTRGNAGGMKRSDKTIAYQHFHPEIIQEIVINQGFTTIDAIPEIVLKDFDLLGNGYTDEDRFKGTMERMEGD